MASRPLLALVGPTASGKTEASLAIADHLGAEIVSVDSMTVYRGMDVGTAKPSPEERAPVPHHLIDVAEPDEEFSVARYQELARRALVEIVARGMSVLAVGGTGLYFRALADELEFPATDPETRRALEVEAGLLQEVRGLLDRGLGPSLTARQAIGYAEATLHLEGELSLEDAIGRTSKRTRALARRQTAWFRRDPRIHWFEAGPSGAIEV